MEPRQRRFLVARAARNALAQKGMTVEQLSARTGIDMSVLRSRLAGITAFDVEELVQVAYALEVSLDSLLAKGAGNHSHHGGSEERKCTK